MSNRPVVLVTEPEYLRGQAVFASATDLDIICVSSDEAALAAEVRRTGARLVVVGHRPYSGPLYDAVPRGGLLARYGVGHESVDKRKATAAGLLCTNTPGTLDQSVAELAMVMVGEAARRLGPMDADFRRGVWKQRWGVELAGKTMAFIGAGQIARFTAQIASRGYGMRTVGFRRRAASVGAVERDGFDVMTSDYAEAVADADFVSVHIPASAENHRFLSAERLAMIPARAWIINTARGAVIDEAALFDALSEGRLAGAALDVFVEEPYVPVETARDLRTLPNVLLVPHVGSYTPEASGRMAARALHNVRAAIRGDYAALDLLNPEVRPTAVP